MDGTVAASDTEVSEILKCPLAQMSVVVVSLSPLVQELGFVMKKSWLSGIKYCIE
jgi:hypothetical protein